MNRTEAPEYYWFCLDHVREYNKRWDYFSGMSSEEIESFRRDAVYGHRPTWNFQIDPRNGEKFFIGDVFDLFGVGAIDGRTRAAPAMPPAARKALSVMELEHPPSVKDIKARYKLLVKRYHPDVNREDPGAEERFKQVTNAYGVLMAHYQNYA